MSDIETGEEDETPEVQTEVEIQLVSKLTPKEISDYVNSLKSLAEYWYYSFFPYDSGFSNDEKVWIDKLNDPNVIAKKNRGIQYCEVASRWSKANDYKEWQYLFIPSKQVMPNSSFLQLAKQFHAL